MIEKLIMSKDRFEWLQERMQNKIQFIREEVTVAETWVHFTIEVETKYDLMDLFHAGIAFGNESMSKALLGK